MEELQIEGFPKKFPCGEVHVKVDTQRINFIADIDGITWIEKRIQNSDDILEILMLADAIRRSGDDRYKQKLGLRIPYVPYSRQDRVMIKGESLSIKVFSDIINAVGFHVVEIWDPHSDVTPALINNCRVVSQEELFGKTMHTGVLRGEMHLPSYILICPDAGARKKIHKAAATFGMDQIIFVDKVRDVSTGNILSTSVNFDSFYRSTEPPFNFIIVDDICDGGRSFIEIAKAINKTELLMGSNYFLHLYVTHGFFTQGLDELKKYFTTISCANLMNSNLVWDEGVQAYSHV